MFHSLFSGNTAHIYICSLVRSFVRTSLFNGNKQFQQFGPMLALCLLVSCSLSFVLSFIRFANIYRVTLTIQSSHLTMARTKLKPQNEDRESERAKVGERTGKKVLIYPFVCTMIREILWYCQKNVENSLPLPPPSTLSFFEPANVSVLND